MVCNFYNFFSSFHLHLVFFSLCCVIFIHSNYLLFAHAIWRSPSLHNQCNLSNWIKIELIRSFVNFSLSSYIVSLFLWAALALYVLVSLCVCVIEKLKIYRSGLKSQTRSFKMKKRERWTSMMTLTPHSASAKLFSFVFVFSRKDKIRLKRRKKKVFEICITWDNLVYMYNGSCSISPCNLMPYDLPYFVTQ